MTATALLSLIDDPDTQPGMSIDDPADDAHYVPELSFVCPEFNKPCNRGSVHHELTLKQLTSHHSGLPDGVDQTSSSFGDEPSQWDIARAPYKTAQCGSQKCDDFTWMNQLKKSWVLFKPDELQAYSGVGLELVGLVEQRISGKPYATFVKDHLFTPLGMTKSTMDPTSVSDSAQAQKWILQLSADKKSWSFSATTQAQSLPGDKEPMLWPAGGLTTSIRELSMFMTMWLSGSAPNLSNGHPLLTPTTMKLAETPIPTSDTVAPNFCKNGGNTDANGNGYSQCTAQAVSSPAFGIGWGVETLEPQLAHGGEIVGSTSSTVLRIGKKMGAAAVVSSDGSQTLAGDNGAFMDVVNRDLLLQSGVNADSATNWDGKALSVGVARVLFLSGKTPSAADLGAFTPAFISSHNLTSNNVAAFLQNWQQTVGACRTFRIRNVKNESEITARFTCAKREMELLLDVENDGSHRISWTDTHPPAMQPQSTQTLAACVNQCAAIEHECIAYPGSEVGARRKACLDALKSCKTRCSSHAPSVLRPEQAY